MSGADIAHADLLPARERAARVTALVDLLRFARSRQPRLQPPGDLAAFWAYYQDLSSPRAELQRRSSDRCRR